MYIIQCVFFIETCAQVPKYNTLVKHYCNETGGYTNLGKRLLRSIQPNYGF